VSVGRRKGVSLVCVSMLGRGHQSDLRSVSECLESGFFVSPDDGGSWRE
jgi:hypothetical protein